MARWERRSSSRYNDYRYFRQATVGEVAARAEAAARKAAAKGEKLHPVRPAGRGLTNTFWGNAWQKHIESFGDYANRLPRGRTYIRNGSVIHLGIEKGVIRAKVQGSRPQPYEITVKVTPLPAAKWKGIKEKCVGGIGSLLELLQGKISAAVMGVVTHPAEGLFPLHGEIDLDCSCPDWADMCKHVAAAMYGVGVRLDEKPELLFLLRGADHLELVGAETARSVVAKGAKPGGRTLGGDGLADVFGIELDETVAVAPATPAERPEADKPTKRAVTAGKAERTKRGVKGAKGTKAAGLPKKGRTPKRAKSGAAAKRRAKAAKPKGSSKKGVAR